MAALRFCPNLSMMFCEEPSLLRRYSLAGRAGFKAVEFAFPYDFDKEELAKEKETLGLKQVLINTDPGYLNFVPPIVSQTDKSYGRS
jgi:hydroxypyruvate isomerase